MFGHVLLTAILCVLIGTPILAQPPDDAAQSTAPLPAFVNLSAVSNDYQVGPGDLLDIEIVGHDDMHQVLRLSNAGEINFPPIGLLRVADLSVFDVEHLIADQLQQGGLIKQPEVLVFIEEYQAKPVYVLGAVVNPGQFIMSQELTVADAVLLAGGLQPTAADKGVVHRRVSADATEVAPTAFLADPEQTRSGFTVLEIDLAPLKEGRFDEGALALRRGDVVVVPEQLMHPFYVVGEVLVPRNYSYPPERTVTVSQAISWAGGPMPTAKLSDGMLVRYDDQGNRQELKVDYTAILKGKQDDFPIEPDDIIFIPGSKIKSITQAFLLMTDQMIMSTSFRVARTYQMPEAPTLPGQPVR